MTDVEDIPIPAEREPIAPGADSSLLLITVMTSQHCFRPDRSGIRFPNPIYATNALKHVHNQTVPFTVTLLHGCVGSIAKRPQNLIRTRPLL